MRMCDLLPGQAGVAGRLALPANERAALARLGLVEGTAVRCLRRCPLGGPGLYRFRGSVFALRAAQTARIELRQEGDAHG